MNLFLNCFISQNISLLVLSFGNIQKLFDNEDENSFGNEIERNDRIHPFQSNKKLESQKNSTDPYSSSSILNNLDLPFKQNPQDDTPKKPLFP